MDKKYKILIPLMIAGAMNTVDTSAMNVTMPTFAEYFNLPLQTVSWISSTYLLVLAGLLLTSGRIGDIYGFVKPFKAGVFITTLGTSLCSLAPSFAFLLVARVIQASGVSLLMSTIPALITTSFPPEERGKAMGFYIISVSIGLLTGPSLGGLILSKFSWRFIFLVNVPLGITAFITSNWLTSKQKEKTSNSFDYAGTFLTLTFLISLLYYLNQGSNIGWLSKTGLALIITSIVSLVTFIYVEKRNSEPMLDLRLFSNKIFVSGLLSTFLYFASQMVMVFLAPVLLNAANYSSKVTGFTVIAFPVSMLIFASVGGHLSDRINPDIVSTIGAAIAGLSIFLIGTLPPLSFSNVDLIWRMFIFGIGGGLFETSVSVTLLSSAPEHMRGIASGIWAMVKNMGMVFGVTISSTLSSLRSEYHRQSLISAVNELIDIATIQGVKDVHMLAFVLIALCALLSLLRIKASSEKKTFSIEKSGTR